MAALTRFGGQSDLVAVKATQVFDKPAELTFEQAAAIPVNYLTAYALLVVMGSLHEGESLLIHNAGGGVGLAALDIAKKIGAMTYGTASPSKHKFLSRARVGPCDRLSQPGLAAGVAATHKRPRRRSDYRSDRRRALEEELRVVETYRTAGHVWCFNRFGGWIGRQTEDAQSGDSNAVVSSRFRYCNTNRGVFGLNLGHMWHEPEKVAIWMRDILRGVEEGWVQPFVDQSFSFADAGKAHQYLEARKNIGKVVLVPESSNSK